MIYVVPTSLAGTVSDTFNIGDLSNALEVGFVTDINNQEGLEGIPIELVVQQTSGTIPNRFDYIMFSKSKTANTSGVLGYYANVKFVNDSTKKVELFSVESDITINSN